MRRWGKRENSSSALERYCMQQRRLTRSRQITTSIEHHAKHNFLRNSQAMRGMEERITARENVKLTWNPSEITQNKNEVKNSTSLSKWRRQPLIMDRIGVLSSVVRPHCVLSLSAACLLLLLSWNSNLLRDINKGINSERKWCNKISSLGRFTKKSRFFTGKTRRRVVSVGEKS